MTFRFRRLRPVDPTSLVSSHYSMIDMIRISIASASSLLQRAVVGIAWSDGGDRLPLLAMSQNRGRQGDEHQQHEAGIDDCRDDCSTAEVEETHVSKTGGSSGAAQTSGDGSGKGTLQRYGKCIKCRISACARGEKRRRFNDSIGKIGHHKQHLPPDLVSQITLIIAVAGLHLARFLANPF